MNVGQAGAALLARHSSAVLAILAAGVFALYVKWVALNESSGYLLASRMLGRSTVDDLDWLDKLSFFREEILVSLIVLPAALPLLLSLGRQRRAVNWCVCSALLLIVCYYVGLLSLGNVGRFLNLAMLRDTIDWVRSHPEAFHDYVGLSSLSKFALLLAVTSAFGMVGLLAQSTAAIGKVARIGPSIVCGLAVGLAVTAFALSLAAALPRLPQHQPILFAMAKALFDDSAGPGPFADMSPESVASEYRALVQAPRMENQAYYGRERNSDIIIFALETAPMRAVRRNGGQHSLPALAQLEHALITAKKHYSTYPYTSDAHFSMFSGIYPVSVRRTLDKVSSGALVYGLGSRLREVNYVTARYAYPDTFEADSRMFTALGIADTDADHAAESVLDERMQQIYADFGRPPEQDQRLSESYLHTDLTSLAALKRDLIKFKKSKQRFLLAFFPILGHAPWIAFGNAPDISSRGRRIIEIQMAWLSEINNLLAANGWLDDTVIVVTADHGIRTTSEDATFPAGTIDEYSFHVPLWIFAPNTVTGHSQIAWTTSHIDLTPTLLHLLGVAEWRAPLYQGSPIYFPELADRHVFFFGAGYLGAHAYTEHNTFWMEQLSTQQVFRNERLAFPIWTLMEQSPETRSIRDRFDTMYSLQARWAQLLGEKQDPSVIASRQNARLLTGSIGSTRSSNDYSR